MDEAAAALNETLAAAAVQLLNRGGSSSEGDSGGGRVRRGAAATAALQGSAVGFKGTDGMGIAGGAQRTTLLWGLFLAAIAAACVLQRRTLWRRLTPRGRLSVRRRTTNPV